MRDIAELEHKRIAARIKDARKSAGLTQQQMAELLGVIQRTYQNYESESSPRIPWDRMSDIERITGKKVEWLLHGDTPDLFEAFEAQARTSLVEIGQKLDDLVDRFGALEVRLAAAAAADDDLRSQIAELAASLAPGASAKS